MSELTPAAQPAAPGQPNAETGGAPPAAPAAPSTPPAGATPAPVTPAAPVEPEYKLTLPQDTLFDASAVERATAFAKDRKLAPEAAQQALEYADSEVRAFQQGTITEYERKKAGWKDESMKHPEFGGEHLTRTLKRVSSVMDRFAKPGSHPYADTIRKDLEETGFGDYPPFVWLMQQIGASMESDGPVTPQGGAPNEQKPLAQRIFPNLPSQNG